jgi:hypothetical protein
MSAWAVVKMAKSRDRSKDGPTPKRQRRKAPVIPDFVRELQDLKGELARQRQWRLDASAGRKVPEHYDYVEIREDDDSAPSRTERRFLKVSGVESLWLKPLRRSAYAGSIAAGQSCSRKPISGV